MNVIETKNISKLYKQADLEIRALDNVSVNFKQGEFTAIVGPSGSGKTTFLNSIGGLDSPTKGQVLIDNNDITQLNSNKLIDFRLKNIGFVFQSYNLIPVLTAKENVEFIMLMQGVSNKIRDKRSKELLEAVGLQEHLNRRPNQLSGGQQQRVAVARSLVFDPQLVLMDEPLGALDKNLRESMQYEIKHIHESIGVTVVYVTHDQSEALTMSSRIAVFNDGKVQQLSTPDKLYEEPVNSFVAEFIGENNTFAGEVTDISDGKCKVKLDTGGEIISNPISVKSKGEKTKVSLRPERAIIDPEEKMDNKHKGKIEEIIYHGDHARVRLNLLGNKEFILKVPNSSARMDIKRGNEINVGWNSHDARALDPKSI